MAIQRIRYLHTWNANNNKIEDAFVNVWHFSVTSDPPASADLLSINTAMSAFYTAIAGRTSSHTLATTAVAKFYNLADPKPRFPIVQYNNVYTGPSDVTALPPEISTCISFAASPVSGVPMARRRGRVFLPPFKYTDYDTDGYITSAAVIATKAAITGLLTASTAAANWEWCIYSTVNDTLAPVIGGWIDNAPDIQRRRGRTSTLRAVWP